MHSTHTLLYLSFNKAQRCDALIVVSTLLCGIEQGVHIFQGIL